ncbi:MAG: DUF350 domain-containing protein [Deltaproteobacteria bacterium]|nr:DUF350 domain-containing protein [Deltaproteobacteria bacterium]
MEQLLADLRPGLILGSLIYSFIGMFIFAVSFWIFNKVIPFSIRKEIEDDQNTALGIIIGSLLIGQAIIIAAAVN